MKLKTIEETLKNKSLKKEFAIITNLKNGDSELFFPGVNLTGIFFKYTNDCKKG